MAHIHLLTLLYDSVLSFVFFLYSHPLQLAYLLYFSPYIIQLISFLFPLLLSTSILLLVLFSLHSIVEGEQLGSVVVVATIGNVFEWEFETMTELYKINVGLVCEVEEDPADQFCAENSANSELNKCFSLNCEVRGDDQMDLRSKNSDASEDSLELSSDKSKKSQSLESHSEIRDEVDPKGSSFVPQTPDRMSEILVTSSLARRAKQRSESLSRSGSMRISLNSEVLQGPNETFWDCNERTDQLSRSQSEKGGSNGRMLHDTLSNCGSMRKEKEWRRTLACKLYEERMTFKLHEERRVAEGAEEMDLLWEAYESDTDKLLKNKERNGKRESCIEEEEEEDDESVGQLCCLQAFRLSTGKMNLGVGRPITKISKVFKGIGLFHRSGSRRSRNTVES